MADCSPGMATQAADIGLLNFKHGYDVAFARDNQSILDNQEDARAWGQLKLRSAQNAATFDHFINMTAAEATAAAIQTGQSEDQQTVSPIRTATGDAIAGTVGVSADANRGFAREPGNFARAGDCKLACNRDHDRSRRVAAGGGCRVRRCVYAVADHCKARSLKKRSSCFKGEGFPSSISISPSQ